MLGAYLTFTAILVLTPGATTAVVVRNTLMRGRAGGVAAALGAALANSSHAIAAAVGLAIVVARVPAALTVLRIAGAAYLAWLGVVSMWRAFRHADGGLRLAATENDRTRAPARNGSFREGLTVNLLNPAIATFYLVAVPSFVPANAPRWWFALLASIHVTMAFTCHTLWAVALGTASRLLARPAARRALEAVTGVALLGLALRVLLQ